MKINKSKVRFFSILKVRYFSTLQRQSTVFQYIKNIILNNIIIMLCNILGIFKYTLISTLNGILLIIRIPCVTCFTSALEGKPCPLFPNKKTVSLEKELGQVAIFSTFLSKNDPLEVKND